MDDDLNFLNAMGMIYTVKNMLCEYKDLCDNIELEKNRFANKCDKDDIVGYINPYKMQNLLAIFTTIPHIDYMYSPMEDKLEFQGVTFIEDETVRFDTITYMHHLEGYTPPNP